MRLSEVKSKMQQEGKLDSRGLLSYATLTGTIHGQSFQNLVAVVFGNKTLDLYHASTNGTVGELYISVPYDTMKDFTLKHRFWYSNTSFTAPVGNFCFYNYDKKVFLRGFQETGILEEKP